MTSSERKKHVQYIRKTPEHIGCGDGCHVAFLLSEIDRRDKLLKHLAIKCDHCTQSEIHECIHCLARELVGEE